MGKRSMLHPRPTRTAALVVSSLNDASAPSPPASRRAEAVQREVDRREKKLPHPVTL